MMTRASSKCLNENYWASIEMKWSGLYFTEITHILLFLILKFATPNSSTHPHSLAHTSLIGINVYKGNDLQLQCFFRVIFWINWEFTLECTFEPGIPVSPIGPSSPGAPPAPCTWPTSHHHIMTTSSSPLSPGPHLISGQTNFSHRTWWSLRPIHSRVAYRTLSGATTTTTT